MSQAVHKPAKSRAKSPKRHRTQPIPSSLQKVTGYGTLTIYQMEASPFWYARYYEEGKIVRRSLRVVDKKEAIKAAKKVFVELKHRKMNKLPFTKASGFEVCARGLLSENEARAARGELSKQKIQYDTARLESDLLPYFGKYEIADIDYGVISGYINGLSKPNRPLSINSLKIHLSHIKTILKYAQRMGVITSLPAFPKLKTVDNARSWFNTGEYGALHSVCRANIGETVTVKTKDGRFLRNVTITQELYDLVIFMTNSFIRPTDVKVLQHKHVAVIRGKETYLRLTHPPTKGHGSPVVTLEKAVEVYDGLLERQRKEGFGTPDDYLFQPEQQNRDYALRNISRQFDQLLKLADLKEAPNGDSRTLYSLRHTCIMNRMIKGDNISLLTLARSARTSVEMIDRFYAKYLTAEMNIEQLQSNRSERELAAPKRSKQRKPAQPARARKKSQSASDGG
jgi:hypothetical protein